jgi:hypothetical protein
MKTEIYIKETIPIEVTFPLFRSRLIGEYGFAGYEKTYWKFDSTEKVTIITERMSETSILTYNDKNHNFFRDMVSIEMLQASGEYNRDNESTWQRVVDRLIQKVSDGI